METGRIISELRISAGLTQEELAERLYVSRALVQKWETGKRRPGKSDLESVAAILGADRGVFCEKDDGIMAELESCVPENCGMTEESVVPLGHVRTILSRTRSKLKEYFKENIK